MLFVTLFKFSLINTSAFRTGICHMKERTYKHPRDLCAKRMHASNDKKICKHSREHGLYLKLPPKRFAISLRSPSPFLTAVCPRKSCPARMQYFKEMLSKIREEKVGADKGTRDFNGIIRASASVHVANACLPDLPMEQGDRKEESVRERV